MGTSEDLSVYNLSLENDLPTWTRKWSKPYVRCFLERHMSYILKFQRALSYSVVRFSPSLVHLATVAKVRVILYISLCVA